MTKLISTAKAYLAMALLAVPVVGLLELSSMEADRIGARRSDPSAELFGGCGYSSESCEAQPVLGLP